MGSPAIAPASTSLVPISQTDVLGKVLSQALRRQRDDAARLIRVVEQTTAPGDRNRHVDYYA